MPALDVIERLREARSHLALVIDEYGGLEGLVTFTDIMRAILGELPDNVKVSRPWCRATKVLVGRRDVRRGRVQGYLQYQRTAR